MDGIDLNKNENILENGQIHNGDIIGNFQGRNDIIVLKTESEEVWSLIIDGKVNMVNGIDIYSRRCMTSTRTLVSVIIT